MVDAFRYVQIVNIFRVCQLVIGVSCKESDNKCIHNTLCH